MRLYNRFGGVAIAVALSLVATTAAHADAADNRQSSNENELLLEGSPVITTASQTKQSISDSPAAVSVITEEDIRNSGLTTVPELLRSLPGVDVTEANSTDESVVIRGFNFPFAGNLLVMIDGHSIYQDSFGGTFWSQEPLLLSRIKQIEVVRGPGSVLYGADAVGGVVNIITKTPAEMLAESTYPPAPSLKGRGDAEYPGVTVFTAKGTQNSTIAEGTFSDSSRGLAYTLGLGYHGTDGFGELKRGQVRDSDSIPMLTFDATQQVPHGSINLTGATDQGKTDFVSQFLDLVDGTTRTNRLSVDYKYDPDHLTVTARTYGTALAAQDGANHEEISTNDFNVQQQSTPWARHTAVVGGSYRVVDATSNFIGPTSRSVRLAGLYGQDEYEAGPRTRLFTGVRLDNNSVYGTNLSPRISLIQHEQHEQTMRLSYSTAFEAPTLFYSYFNVTLPEFGVPIHEAGNTSLESEKVNSVEASYRHDVGKGYTELTAFHNAIARPFTSVVTAYAQPPGYPFPIPTASTLVSGPPETADGFEVDARAPINRTTEVRANYSYLNALQQGHRVELSPRNHINASVQSHFQPRWNAYFGMHFVDSDFIQSTVPMRMNIAPYTDFDAKIGYKIAGPTQPWEVSVASTNLFNTPHYELPNIIINGNPSAAPIPRQVWLQVSGGW